VYLKKGVGVRVAKNYGNIEVKRRHAFCLFLFFFRTERTMRGSLDVRLSGCACS